MRFLQFFSFFASFLFGCNVEEIPIKGSESPGLIIEKRIESETVIFDSLYANFTEAWKNENKEQFNGFIHSDKGLYIIESNGALPSIIKLDSLERSFFKRNRWNHSFVVIRETLPEVDCDATNGFYNKVGCFVEDTNPFIKSEIWKYAGLDSIQEETLAALAKTISVTVINTSGFVAYFSLINGRYHLTILDLRVPCSA